MLTRNANGQRAVELIGIFNRARLAREAGGAALYGPNLSQWPAWAVDLTALLEGERIAFENAQFEAERLDR